MNEELTREIPHVYRLALRLARNTHVAEDLTQETMLKAVRKLDQLESAERVRVWLFRILSNTWRDHLRTAGRRPAEPLQHPVPANAPPAEDTAVHKEHLHSALAAMNALPEKQRAVLHLFVVEELSLREIGQSLGLRPETAKVHLFHARKAMQRKLPQLAALSSTATSKPLR